MDKFPPGPTRRLPGTLLLSFRRDPIKFLTKAVHEYGDFVHFKAGRRDVFFVSRPDLIQDVLVTQSQVFVKREGKGRSRRGEGLITTASDFSLRHRPLVSPSFHREEMEGYASVVRDVYERETRDWKDGSIIDVHRSMLRLTLLVIGRTLFQQDLGPEAEKVGRAMNEFLEFFSRSTMPLADIVERIPLTSNRNFLAARKDLDSLIYRVIKEAKSQPLDRHSLLSRLASRELGGGEMTDSQIRDEMLTILLAGHETTGNALTWAWHLISRYPEVERRLHDEVREVLGGRPPTGGDLQRLQYTEMTFNETLRVYPPAWIMMRQARQESTLGDCHIPKGSLVLVSQYITHHDPRYFTEPEKFDPERWTKDRRSELPRYAFFPFGGGPRTCIGEPLARLEGVLLLASVAQKWRLVPVTTDEIVPLPHITLRPRGGLRMKLERRGS
jgi:cytochrome P450